MLRRLKDLLLVPLDFLALLVLYIAYRGGVPEDYDA